jgi:hypothetical protein
MKHITRILVLAGAVVATFGIAATGWAYWTSSGAGAASATVGTLNAPPNVSASADHHTVTVTWSPSSTGSGAVTPLSYSVERYTSGGVDSGPASCGAVDASGTLTCQDTVAGLGSYKYKVTAVFRSWTATSGFSGTITVTPGPATQLVYTTQPGGTITGGNAFGTQPVVAVKDAFGFTVTSDTTSVTLAIKSGTGTAGASLSGTNTVSAVAGVASFSGLSIDKSGSGYVLTATDGSLTTADSSAFTVSVGQAAKLTFTTQPGGTITGGTAFATQPVVAVQDAGGNTVTGNSSQVSLAIKGGTGTSGATLSCAPVNAVSGLATFSGCKIDKSGSGYVLTATDGSLTTADSSAFTVSVGQAAQVSFSTQPSSAATGGTAFATQPQVTVKDAGGNLVASSPVSLAVTAGSGGGAGGTLSCSTNAVNTNASGVAVFAGCSINTKSSTAYTLTATDGAATAISDGITISVGSAAQLVFNQQPSNSTGGVAFGTQPKVTIKDAGGNTVTTDSSTVTLSITSGTPTSGGPGILSGCTQTETAGVITFAGCKIDTIGTSYKLHAVDGALTADSSAFNVSLATSVTGIEWASVTKSGGSIACTGAGTANYACTVSGGGNNTAVSAQIMFVNSSGAATVGSPSGQTVTVSYGANWKSGTGATSLVIAGNATTSAGTPASGTASGANTATMTATIGEFTATLTVKP